MDKIIFFTILVLFPFGQLFKFGIVNLFDVLVLLLALITIFKKPQPKAGRPLAEKYPEWYKYFTYFIFACIFSLLANYRLIDIKSILYLVRLVSYSLVAVYISNFLQNRKSMYSVLISVSVAVAIFGWFQYLIWPDLTTLKYLGWDDHLFRMIGTFLDPTYLGLIIVLGIIIAVFNNYKKTLYFLLISLAFTYSRSSYLVASLFLIFKKKYLGLLIFGITILLLPKMIGEGTTLSRSSSINLKILNYQETLTIIKKSPVFGVGFDNICAVRQLFLKDINSESHSCSGSDSSILFLLATSGIVGLILFINFLLHIPRSPLLITSFVAVLIHSLFANSLFYPHIMFWLFCLVGLQTEVDSKSS